MVLTVSEWKLVNDTYLWTPIFITLLRVMEYAKAPYGTTGYIAIHTAAKWLHY